MTGHSARWELTESRRTVAAWMDFLEGSHSMPSAIPMKELVFSRFFRAFLRAAVKADNSAQIDSHGWLVLAIGILTSFVVAYCAVAWFLAWVRKHGFVPFAIYRLALGVAVLVWAF